MKNKNKPRSASGLSMVFLLAFITFFIIGPLSVFVYELSRYNLAAQQLKYCADSAALAAAASTTSSNANDVTVTMTQAMDQAQYIFNQNSILDHQLTDTPPYTYGTANAAMTPTLDHAQLYYQFLDPVTKSPVAYGSPNGKILQISAAWGYKPISSNFTHIAAGPYVITQVSDGGLPLLDVVLCFDISASMDDFTNVTLVNRWRNGTSKTALNKYAMATPYGVVHVDSTTGNAHYSAQGPLYYAVGCTANNGIPLNATWPIQFQCEGSGYSASFSSGNHGVNNNAVPPITSQPGNYVFSDMVVNIDGTEHFTNGVTTTNSGGTFYFPPADSTNFPYGILCEAARGNLENETVAGAAGIDTSSAGFKKYSGFSFKPGWFQAYYTLAMQIPTIAQITTTPTLVPIRRPIGDAIVAARAFFSVLNNDADVHFGLVTFSDTAGQSQNDTVTSTDSIGSQLQGSPGGTLDPGGFPSYSVIAAPNPTIFLNPNAGPTYSNYDSSTSPANTSVNGALYYTTANTGSGNYGINSLLAEGGTNIADSLDLALAMHLGSHASDPSSLSYGKKNLGRKGATRAIVLFTDGYPTAGGDSAPGSWPASIAEAKLANKANIPIYTIGLCLVDSLQAGQKAVLSNDQTQYPNGIAGLSGNNSTFAQTTDASQLTAIFQNVARQLVQLVRTGN